MSNPFGPVGPAHNSFLPEDYIRSKAEGRANIITLTLFAVVLAAVMGAFVVTKASVQQVAKRKSFVNQQFQEAGRKIDQLKALESQQAQMMEKAEITAALVEKVPRWAVLAELTLRMPTDMRLDSMVIKCTRPKPEPQASATAPKPPPIKSIAGKVAGAIKGQPEKKEPDRPKPQVPRFTYSLTLEGTAMKNQDFSDYLSSLKSSPVLDRVEMAFIREVKEGDKEFRKFQVTAEVRTSIDTSVLSKSLQALVAARTRLVAEAEKQNEPAPAGTPTAAVKE
ncbi:hypothetical protein PHYC_02655 [Phycisphaerales bacterium]|nr:hypothetical protein PHYC_02655 [Phycisphaerales bacterium]